MVASRAKISRPRPDAAGAGTFFAASTKAAMSSPPLRLASAPSLSLSITDPIRDRGLRLGAIRELGKPLRPENDGLKRENSDRRSVALLLPSRHQRHHRPVQLVSQGRLSRDLFGRWAPFLDAADGEAGVDQRIQRRAQGPVLFPHAFRQPVGDPCAFDGVMVDRPGPAAIRGRQPSRRSSTPYRSDARC